MRANRDVQCNTIYIKLITTYVLTTMIFVLNK